MSPEEAEDLGWHDRFEVEKEYQDAIDILVEENKRLREALKPFAQHADWPLFNLEDERPVVCRVYPKGETHSDRWTAGFGYTVADFRRAREALGDINA